MSENPFVSVSEAPIHTIVGRKTEGTTVTTTVLVDGEFIDFEISEATRRAVQQLNNLEAKNE